MNNKLLSSVMSFFIAVVACFNVSVSADIDYHSYIGKWEWDQSEPLASDQSNWYTHNEAWIDIIDENDGVFTLEYYHQKGGVHLYEYDICTGTAEGNVITAYTDARKGDGPTLAEFRITLTLNDNSIWLEAYNLDVGGVAFSGMMYNNDRPVVDESDNITVTVNGENVVFDQPPVILNGRTLVPIRAICEAMGFDVTWDQETSSANITNDIAILNIPIDSEYMYMGTEHEVKKWIDVPAQIIGERTLVPARVIAESFGADVSWDGDSRTVSIQYSEPEYLEFVEGSPPQYGTTHALISETAIKLIKQRYGIAAELVMTGNTLQWYEGGGYVFTVERWYNLQGADNYSVYDVEMGIEEGSYGEN